MKATFNVILFLVTCSLPQTRARHLGTMSQVAPKMLQEYATYKIYKCITYKTMLSEVFCRVLRPPANGNVDLGNSAAQVQHNTVAFYSCNTGYNLIGNVQRTCQQEVWTGTEPLCQGK